MIIAIADKNLFQSNEEYIQHMIHLTKDVDYLILRKEDDINSIKQIVEYVDPNKIILYSNEDLCHKLSIHNLHLPEYRINHIKNEKINYSYSVHSFEHIQKIYNGANFILISTIFSTSCKPNKKPLNRNLIKKITSEFSDKIVALGGIDEQHLECVKKMNFKHIAIRSKLMDKEYKKLIQKARELGF